MSTTAATIIAAQRASVASNSTVIMKQSTARAVEGMGDIDVIMRGYTIYNNASGRFETWDVLPPIPKGATKKGGSKFSVGFNATVERVTPGDVVANNSDETSDAEFDIRCAVQYATATSKHGIDVASFLVKHAALIHSDDDADQPVPSLNSESKAAAPIHSDADADQLVPSLDSESKADAPIHSGDGADQLVPSLDSEFKVVARHFVTATGELIPTITRAIDKSTMVECTVMVFDEPDLAVFKETAPGSLETRLGPFKPAHLSKVEPRVYVRITKKFARVKTEDGGYIDDMTAPPRLCMAMPTIQFSTMGPHIEPSFDHNIKHYSSAVTFFNDRYPLTTRRLWKPVLKVLDGTVVPEPSVVLKVTGAGGDALDDDTVLVRATVANRDPATLDGNAHKDTTEVDPRFKTVVVDAYISLADGHKEEYRIVISGYVEQCRKLHIDSAVWARVMSTHTLNSYFVLRYDAKNTRANPNNGAARLASAENGYAGTYAYSIDRWTVDWVASLELCAVPITKDVLLADFERGNATLPKKSKFYRVIKDADGDEIRFKANPAAVATIDPVRDPARADVVNFGSGQRVLVDLEDATALLTGAGVKFYALMSLDASAAMRRYGDPTDVAFLAKATADGAVYQLFVVQDRIAAKAAATKERAPKTETAHKKKAPAVSSTPAKKGKKRKNGPKKE